MPSNKEKVVSKAVGSKANLNNFTTASEYFSRQSSTDTTVARKSLMTFTQRNMEFLSHHLSKQHHKSITTLHYKWLQNRALSQDCKSSYPKHYVSSTKKKKSLMIRTKRAVRLLLLRKMIRKAVKRVKSNKLNSWPRNRFKWKGRLTLKSLFLGTDWES